ncbi:hypothetical protein AB0E08_07570 [Streptomyces sp. NPDC048281]|uniref:hypothetical protein n=1 Tax=Streptomyces sp. NPDC048281 TaxID=3154715 RepID=UPI0034285688
MSDDGRREWVAANQDAFTELLIPRAFLAASAVADEPTAPDELNTRLCTASGSRPAAGNCVRVDWPVDLLRPLADYADSCERAWSGPVWSTARVAAEALAGHARHAAEMEA